MALTPEPILTHALLAIAQPRPTSVGRCQGFCPFHAGSTAHDLLIDELYGRFHCIVCGATGWSESGYRRERSRAVERAD